MATAAFGLASVQPAFADTAPAPPAESTNAETTSAPPTQEAPPAETTESESAPAESESAPPPAEPSGDSTPPPSADAETEAEAGDGSDAAEPDAAEPAEAPAEQAPAETKPPQTTTPDAKDVVKLEPAPAAPAAPAASPAAAAPAAAATPSAAPTSVVIVLIQDAPAAPAATVDSEAAKAEAALAAAAIVSFRPRPAAGPISLPPATEPADNALRKARTAPAPHKPLLRQQTCARPTGRVPLSLKCKQVRAVASLQITLTNLHRLPEVPAAIARGTPQRVTVGRDEARPPPKSKAAKKRPVPEVRPVVPFGHSGQGMTNDGFRGSAGSASSSRLFAVALVTLRVHWPSRFARLRLPSMRPHGVIPAPPSARPG